MNKITRQSLQHVQDNTEYRTCSFHLQHRIFRLQRSVFYHCSFRSWTVLVCHLENCIFINCNFAGINVEYLKNTYFQKGFIEDLKITPRDKNIFASFQEVNISNLNISWTNYYYTILTERSPITEIPEEIFEFSSLKELNLSRNRLTSLPPEIKKLSNLRSLIVRSNQLTKLPAEIGELIRLEELDLHKNNIYSLPSALGKLKQLRTLRLPLPTTYFPYDLKLLPNLTIERYS